MSVLCTVLTINNELVAEACRKLTSVSCCAAHEVLFVGEAKCSIISQDALATLASEHD